MKNIFYSLVACCLILNCSSYKQTNFDEMALKSFNYLIDKGQIKKDITVSDTIVEMNLSDFTMAILNKGSKLNQSKLYDSLDNISRNNVYKRYYHPLNELIKNNSKDDYKIYFSKSIDNFIMAEVFDLKSNFGKTAYETSYFGNSKKYLFYFEGNKIVKFYSLDWRYN